MSCQARYTVRRSAWRRYHHLRDIVNAEETAKFVQILYDCTAPSVLVHAAPCMGEARLQALRTTLHVSPIYTRHPGHLIYSAKGVMAIRLRLEQKYSEVICPPLSPQC